MKRMELFLSHPPLQARIAALEAAGNRRTSSWN